jgi:hypothetical protein
MSILTTFIKRENLDPKDSLIALKRLNRVVPNVYDEISQVVNANLLQDPEVIIEKLEVKFSLLTTINTIVFIQKLVNFYLPDKILQNKYEELHAELINIYENPHSFQKMTYSQILNFIQEKHLNFIRPCDNHTKYRNFLLLALLILEIPLKLVLLTDIHYLCYEGCDFDDTLEYSICILKKNDDFYLIRNFDKNLAKQVIYKFENPLFIKLLKKFVANHLVSYKSIFSSANGKGISKSNISNGLVNFTKKEFGFPLGINDCQRIWKKWIKNQDPKKILLLTTLNS